MPDTARYLPSGRLLAIAPQALGQEFPVISPPIEGIPFEAYRLEGSAAIVDITGPINYALTPCPTDTYGFIRQRVAAAIACSESRYIVLRIHSPGGEVAGAFDTARALRRMCAEAQKPLIAFTEGDMCSAAYALGSAGAIVASESAAVGSIGVLSAHAEYSRAEDKAGITWAILTSGARKPDGNPHMPFSEAAIAAMQSHVDANAEVFFRLVAEHRGIPVDALEALQGRILLGAQAREAGLADHVMSWDQLMAVLGDGQAAAKIFTPLSAVPVALGAIEGSAMAKAEDKKEDKPDLAALMAEAESDDLEKRARARKALRAYFSDSEPDGDKDDARRAEDADESEGDARKAESADEADESRKAAAAPLGAVASSLAAQVSAQAAEIAAMKAEAKARADAEVASALSAIKASRPDLAKVFAGIPNLDLNTAQSLVASIPAPTSFHVDPLSGSVIGKGGDGGASHYGERDRGAFERAFPRLAKVETGVKNAGFRQVFHSSLPLVNAAPAAEGK